VAKDRAAPFSRKHRRYWIPVTGGMILIGVVNVAIGLSSYKNPPPPQRLELVIPVRDAAPLPIDAAGTIGAHALPADVMRAFAVKYPRTMPAGASVDGEIYTVDFPPGAPHAHARFRGDGTFVSDD
jgi:hypothetical protein